MCWNNGWLYALSSFWARRTMSPERFTGGKGVPGGDFDNIMEAAGGANNAYTSSDVTVYQDWFPRSALDTIFALETDRLGNLKIDPDVVQSEREVVYSERRSGVDDNNSGPKKGTFFPSAGDGERLVVGVGAPAQRLRRRPIRRRRHRRRRAQGL